jgi:diguanylate cyclase (GGDEF)-like protein/PAS domain S-box-containing protein
LPTSWNISLVLLSVLVAVIGSFTALTHAQRMRESGGRVADLWMAAGGITLGLAVWAMHFIGMLAFHLPVPVSYDPFLTLLSVLPVIAASLLGFRVLRDLQVDSRRIALGGLVMGVGISAMHYTGMAALKMSPAVGYDPVVFTLSVAIAVIAAWGALRMMYLGGPDKRPTLPRYLMGAAIMGLAISGMHYTAMAGTLVQPGSVCLAGPASISPNLLAVMVASISLFWFGGGILASLFDQGRARQSAHALRQLEQTYLETLGRSEELAYSMTKSLRDSEARFRQMFERHNAAMLLIDPASGAIVDANNAAGRFYGYPISQMKVMNINEINSLPQDQITAELAHARREERNYFVFPHRLSSGEIRTVEVHSSPLEVGDKQLLFSVIHDITERHLAEAALRQSVAFSESLLQTMPVPVFYKDVQGRYTGCNNAFAEFIGKSKKEIVGKTVFEVSPQDLSRVYRDKDLELLDDPAGVQVYESRVKHSDGSEHDVVFHKARMIGDDGRPSGIIGVILDITERKQAEQQIHQLAFYDPLTELPNRRLLLDRLHQEFAIGARTGQHGAILFLDLDNFKTLNDTKGHDIGDMLLVEVAQRLKACVRDGDTVARLGGDEFVVVLESLSPVAEEAANQAEQVAEKIHGVLNQPYTLRDHAYHTTPSIGIVLFRGHQDSLDNLLKYADTAMYQAKTAGRNAIRFYDPEMQAAIEARADLEDELRQALARQQLRLYYQIQVDSRGHPLGAEVLLRWEHAERGLVSPAQFIPLAEETGLIVPMGLWVLQTACAQLAAWQQDAQTAELTIAVNVSAKQFRQPDFVEQVQRILTESGAKPALLKLELTESTVLENVEDTISKMRAIKQLGVSFSMDDFGTGYSSLQYLKRLPLAQIKIDQSFVRDLASDPNDAAIVQTIIAMSQALGLNAIAEGVETEAQREFLERYGCHAFQGYFFGKPLPLEKFMASLPHG